jgi:hypothetical protein
MIGKWIFFKRNSSLNSFYLKDKEFLHRVRYSEFFALLNILQSFAISVDCAENDEYWDWQSFEPHLECTQNWCLELMNDPEIESNESEFFYENLLALKRNWTVTELKVAYYTKTGMAEKKICQFKRWELNELNRVKSHLKKRFRLKRNESFSFYLSNFN